MVTQQLIDYIKDNLNQGKSKEEITNILLSNNWPIEDIETAFKMVLDSTTGSINSISSQSSAIGSHRLLSFGELFRNTFDLYKKKFLALIGIAAIPELITILAVTLIKNNPSSSVVTNFIIIVALTLLTIVLNLLSVITIIYVLKDDKISIVQAYQNSLKNILNVLWINVLSLSIISSLPLIFIILGFTLKSLLIPFLILSALLFLVPGLIFLMWFIFSNYVLIVENIKGIKALLRSKEYTKGQINNIFSRLFIAGLLVVLFIFVIAFIMEIIVALLKSALLEKIVNLIINILNVTFLTTFTYLLYLNIRDLKGGQIYLENKKEEKLYWVLAIIGLIMLLILPFKVVPYFSSELKSMQDTNQKLMIISEMNALGTGVRYYAEMKGKYPQTLDELFNTYPELFPREPIDPITNKPYHYELLNNGTNFKICSGFGTPQENCITGNQ